MANKYDLTIGMIVKNEEKYLEQCLQSLLPLKERINCEIIITDTGSSDKTVEIAEQYADKVLHFEWCDDFSAARNTGVEEAQGDWFMYVDADQIFDESVIQIADFIESEDRDNYNSASYMEKNVRDSAKNIIDNFVVVRLFNFKNGKSFFQGKIHEFIKCVYPMFKLDCGLTHYGYTAELVEEKRKRNKILLEKEYEEKPNDLRIIKHLMDTVSNDERVELANKVFDLIDSEVENSYQNIQNLEYAFISFCSLANLYIKSNDYDSIIETCERYQNTKLIQHYYDKADLPHIDMNYMYAYALFNKGEYEKSLEEFLKYQELYNGLHGKPSNMFETLSVYQFNNEVEYSKSDSFIIDIYLSLGDEVSALNQLEKTDMYKHQDCEQLLNIYVMKVIKFNRKELFDKIEQYYNEKFGGYDSYDIIFIGRLYFYRDLSYFFENYSLTLIDKILSSAYGNLPQFKDHFYEVLTGDLEVSSLAEAKVYIQVAYFHLMSQVDSLKADNVDNSVKQKVEEVFVFYVESMIYYLNELYSPVMFQPQNFDVISKEDAMCIIISAGFENRETNQVEYIKALKEALIYNDKFKYIILNSIDVLENSVVAVTEELEESEFDILSKKIKQTVSVLIVKKELEQAKDVLSQYKSINPNDPDIEKFNQMLDL